jgi:hypothetical protein
MQGVTEHAIDEMVRLGIGCDYFVSFYEIYGGRCFDLLNGGRKVQILEDGNNEVRKLIESLKNGLRMLFRAFSSLLE